ncbi:hypothetical protein GW781_10910 [bacterium]|nr:hypothetical protein [bacterium]NCT21654.1 hypothetical protein [bacterium]
MLNLATTRSITRTVSGGMTITALLERMRPLPQDNALLGICSDGMGMTYPILPRSRPLLVLGSQGAGKTALLKTLAWSARANLPHLAPLIVTDELREWNGFGSIFHFSQLPVVAARLKQWTPGVTRLLVLLDNVAEDWPGATEFMHACVANSANISLVATAQPTRWGNLLRQVFAQKMSFVLGQGATEDLLPGQFILRWRSQWMQFSPATF